MITPRLLVSMKLTSRATSSPGERAHFFEGLRGVELGGEQHTVGLLQLLQALGREAAALKADFVDAEGAIFAA